MNNYTSIIVFRTHSKSLNLINDFCTRVATCCNYWECKQILTPGQSLDYRADFQTIPFIVLKRCSQFCGSVFFTYFSYLFLNLVINSHSWIFIDLQYFALSAFFRLGWRLFSKQLKKAFKFISLKITSLFCYLEHQIFLRASRLTNCQLIK